MATASDYQYSQTVIGDLQAQLDAINALITEQQAILDAAIQQKSVYALQAQGLAYTIDKLTTATEPDAPEI